MSALPDARESKRLGMEFRRAPAIAVKEVRTYCPKPPALLFGLALLPLPGLPCEQEGIHQPRGITGPTSIRLFFASSNVAPAGTPFERKNLTFRRYPTALFSRTWTLFGKSLSGFAFGACVSVFPVLLDIIVCDTRVCSPGLLVPSLLASGLCFYFLGTLVANMPTEAPAT